MTSRLRGSAKEEPKPTSLLSSKSRTYLSSGREPRDKPTFEGSRKKVSRKDSRGKHDGGYEVNGCRSPKDDLDEDEDPDFLYRRSRDHFGSWDIKEIIGKKDQTPVVEDRTSKNDRKSRFDLFKSNGVEGQRIITNGNARSKHKSPENRGFDNLHEKRFDSNERKHSKSRSPDLDRDRYKSNKKNNGQDKTGAKSPPKEVDRTTNPPRYQEEEYRPRSNRALLQEIENFGSNRRRYGKRTESPEPIERRYSGNISPEHDNDKIRSLIDRFKSNDRNNETQESTGKKSTQRHRSSSRENDTYRVKIRSGDDLGSTDRKLSKEKYEGWHPSLDRKASRNRRYDIEDDERRLGSSSRKWKENDDGKYRPESPNRKHAEPEAQNYRSLERRKQRTDGDPRESIESGFRKRSDTYNVERSVRQKSREPDDGKESSSKRRSYVYSGSPEEFDVQIQRYERALTGPRKDPELSKKTEVKRRSSLKIKDEMNEAQERNGRHNRPLTPPEDSDHNFEPRRTKDFNSKDWYEANKQFAVKYLQDNSKLRSPGGDRNDIELESGRDRVRQSSPIGEPKEIYFGERRRNSPDEDLAVFRKKHTSSSIMDAMESNERNNTADFKPNRKPMRNSIEVDRTNGRSEPITIKIRNVLDGHSENDRRTNGGVFVRSEEINDKSRKRRDDDSPKRDARGNRDKDWTSATTPARKIWNYRDGGAQITDVDEGQPCLKCKDACPGFQQHAWRKNCASCKCPRETHEVCHEEWVSVRSRLGLKGDGASGSVACDPKEMGLAWAPPGLPAKKVEEYFKMLPEISVPRLGMPGERYRDRQLAMQLPKQDLAKAYCRHLATEHYTSADDFMAARNEIALDIGTVQEILESGINCANCKESLKYGSLAVSAGKLGEYYHPACFQCVQCRELLVDLAYCVYNDAVYCERHYAERLKGRCAACDELIFSGEFTRAMNKDWHSGHFCCWQCDESLTGQRYVLRDEHPYCIKCYESVFANGCEECSKIIGIDSKDLSYKDKHWHEACFLCNKCRVSLVDKQFGSKVDKIYCGNCYDAQFASRCDGCGEIFRAGTKKMEYKTRQWHEKCFCCVVCKNPIGTKSFIPREQEIYCAGCYEDKFATRCVKCNKIINSGGVTYKNEPWHRECFTCSNCSTSLAGQRFTSRDEKPYCADCFGELFAKRCTACTKPITGIGGTRFISFEDRHWHNDCFICAGCKTSLVGRGFITDADDIICPECAKQKLM